MFVPSPKLVLTTVYPLADIARQVGGNRVKVEWLIDSPDRSSE